MLSFNMQSDLLRSEICIFEACTLNIEVGNEPAEKVFSCLGDNCL